MDPIYYKQLLINELKRRQGLNPRYSLRAFAKNIDIDVGTLSNILSGRKPLSINAANKIADKMKLEGEGRLRFLASVAKDQITRKLLPLSEQDKNSILSMIGENHIEATS